MKIHQVKLWHQGSLAIGQYAIQVVNLDEKHQLEHGAYLDRNYYQGRLLLQPSHVTLFFGDIKLNRNNFLKSI
jgi:hypothetical protein